MAFPMLAGTFAMNAYNLTDTWFVSRLGTLSLAAMGFTFPVVMLLTCVAGGLGVGTTTLMSHAVGRHDGPDAARITTHGLALTLGVAAGMAVIGYLSMNPRNLAIRNHDLTFWVSPNSNLIVNIPTLTR